MPLQDVNILAHTEISYMWLMFTNYRKKVKREVMQKISCLPVQLSLIIVYAGFLLILVGEIPRLFPVSRTWGNPV